MKPIGCVQHDCEKCKKDETLLRQALDALEGFIDQPETTEAYDASMDRGLLAIDALRERLGEKT